MATETFDIRYGGKDRDLYDRFIPDTSYTYAIIFAHGGGWENYNKSLGTPLGRYWANRTTNPVAVYSINYTLSAKGVVGDCHPQNYLDVAAAVNHIMQNEEAGKTYVISGHSAGSHLMALCMAKRLFHREIGGLCMVDTGGFDFTTNRGSLHPMTNAYTEDQYIDASPLRQQDNNQYPPATHIGGNDAWSVAMMSYQGNLFLSRCKGGYYTTHQHNHFDVFYKLYEGGSSPQQAMETFIFDHADVKPTDGGATPPPLPDPDPDPPPDPTEPREYSPWSYAYQLNTAPVIAEPPSTGFALSSSEYTQSRTSLQALSPLAYTGAPPPPSGIEGQAQAAAVDTSFTNSRYGLTHSQLPYEVPVIVSGGAPPYHYTIDGIEGATIERMAPEFNPHAYLWAKVTLPAGAEGIYNVHVFDQEHTQEPALSIPVTVTQDDSRFIFVDAAAGGGGDGSWSSPFNSMADWYGDVDDATHTGKICVHRAGDYIVPVASDLAAGLQWGVHKPIGWIGYPGEDVTISHRGVSDIGYMTDYNGADGEATSAKRPDQFIANLNFRNAGNFFSFQTYEQERHTWWDVSFSEYGASGTNMTGAIQYDHAYGGGAPHNFLAFANVSANTVSSYSADPDLKGILLSFGGVENLAAVGVTATDFNGSSMLLSTGPNYRAFFSGWSGWKDNTFPVGAVDFRNTSEYFDNVGWSEGVTQSAVVASMSYSRFYSASESDLAVQFESADNNTAMGKNYIDRSTIFNRVRGVGSSAFLSVSDSVLSNSLWQGLPTSIFQVANQWFSRIASLGYTTYDGELYGLYKYRQGFEVREP